MSRDMDVKWYPEVCSDPLAIFWEDCMRATKHEQRGVEHESNGQHRWEYRRSPDYQRAGCSRWPCTTDVGLTSVEVYQKLERDLEKITDRGSATIGVILRGKSGSARIATKAVTNASENPAFPRA